MNYRRYLDCRIKDDVEMKRKHTRKTGRKAVDKFHKIAKKKFYKELDKQNAI